MNKIKETMSTIFVATQYSFAFCWRNSKQATAALIAVSIANTLVVYLAIQATGSIINAVQRAVASHQAPYSFVNFLHSDLVLPSILMLAVILCGIIIGRVKWYFSNSWKIGLHFANRRELNEHRATLDIARFKSKEFDDLTKSIEELPSSWQTRITFSEQLFDLFTTVISFVLFGAALVMYQPVYALVLIIAALPAMVIEFRLVQMWWNLFQGLVPKHKRRFVLEKAYNQPTTFMQALMFNQMPTLRKEIDINVNGILDEYDYVRKTSLKKKLLANVVMFLGLGGVIVYAVWSTVAYGLGIGTLTVIVAAARTFQGNLESIVSMVADQWNNAKGVIMIEKDFFGLRSSIVTESPVTPSFIGKAGVSGIPLITFDHVSFAYPTSDTLAVKDVSFTIEPGSKVAIVGKSGNGKSTLQGLLMRQYDPTSGAIFADGINLRNIKPEDWTKVASALTQEYTVLERTIADEIASSRLGQAINPEDVTTSSRFANFDEVVGDDSRGYDAQIGTQFNGREFSGGEKQRLALARVHYRGTPVMIFDEPDAKLDPDSAKKVIDQVFALKDVTVVMITHHVSRALRCDKVIMMGKGEIVEQGTPAELMTTQGAFARMYLKDKHRLGSEG